MSSSAAYSGGGVERRILWPDSRSAACSRRILAFVCGFSQSVMTTGAHCVPLATGPVYLARTTSFRAARSQCPAFMLRLSGRLWG
jgi:hypothetical protein